MSKQIFVLSLVVISLFAFQIRAQDNNQNILIDAIGKNDTILAKSILLKQPLYIDSIYNEESSFGFTHTKMYPIHHAFSNSSIGMIDFLLRSGANPDRTVSTSAFFSRKETSSLEILVERNDLNILSYYFGKLAITPRSYAEALILASENKNKELVRYLLDKGEKILLK